MAQQTDVIAPEKRLHIASFQKHYSPKMCAWRTFPISHSFCGHFNKHGSGGSVSGETSAAAPQNFRQYPMQIVPQASTEGEVNLSSLPPLPSCSYSLWTRQIGLFTLSAARRKFGNPPPLLLLFPSRLRQSSLHDRALESRESFRKVSFAPKAEEKLGFRSTIAFRKWSRKNGVCSISLSAPPAADKEHRKTPKKRKQHLDSILTPRGEGRREA